MKRYVIIFSAVLTALGIMAQKPFRLTGQLRGVDTKVSVENIKVTKVDEKTLVTMNFILDSLKVPSNRYRAFTPIIRNMDGSKEQRLKTLIVSGRRQGIVFEREGIDPLYADNCVDIRRLKGEPQRYSYSDDVLNEEWHNDAQLFVECDLCGCGDQMKSELAHLGTLLPPDPMKMVGIVESKPQYKPKKRSLHGSAFINFIVDRWEMRPEYMNNLREIRKITDTLDVMVADPNITVREIKIHGWASPESPYEHNHMLATNRAKSLTDYVRKLYNLPADVFATAEATPENWIGLREAAAKLDNQTLPHKKEILEIIDKVLKDLGNNITKYADRDEHLIRSKYPAEYRYLLREVYPGLRRSDYEISFNISEFTLEQAKEIYKTKPYQLSLLELFELANTYPRYSDEYNKVMQTAVVFYPEEPEANLNLANVAMHQKDLLKAETLLEHAGKSAEADNARCALAILKGHFDEAEKWLKSAADKGFDVRKNREAIEKLR